MSGIGERKLYYADGQISSHAFYVDGQMHGEGKWYHPDGQISSHAFFVDGKRHGECKWYRENGQISSHAFFVGGEVVVDFLENPELYPCDAELKTMFALRYGIGDWL